MNILATFLLVLLATVGAIAAVVGFFSIVVDVEVRRMYGVRRVDTLGPIVMAVGCAFIAIAVAFLR